MLHVMKKMKKNITEYISNVDLFDISSITNISGNGVTIENEDDNKNKIILKSMN